MKSKNIKVGNRKYTILLLTDEDFDQTLSKKGVDDVDIKSFIDYDDQIICVRSRLKQDHRQELILHELLHACAEDAGLKQDEKFEEFVLSFSPRLSVLISSGLQDILID
jgi:hypothetical protein